MKLFNRGNTSGENNPRNTVPQQNNNIQNTTPQVSLKTDDLFNNTPSAPASAPQEPRQPQQRSNTGQQQRRPFNRNRQPNRSRNNNFSGEGQQSTSYNPNNQNPNNPNRRRNNNTNKGGRPNNFQQGRRTPHNGQRTQNFNQKRNSDQSLFHSSNALNWGNSSVYQFRDNDMSERLKIIPIGGVEEVGVNCTILEYGNDILIIDAGLGFEGNLPGIDSLVPNLEYLYDKKDKIRGIVITHGHTDHIGGLHYIIDKIGFPPIYAPRLAAGLIRSKMKETPFKESVKINEIDGESSYYLGKFHLSHFRMTHSIPDNYGIAINTPVGRVVTPSDYKFDNSPYKESPCDFSKLAKLGDEGVLALLSESTYSKVRGWAPSGSIIAEDIEGVIRDAHGRLLIGMFSTMVNRMRQVVELAAKYNKKVAVMGRSIENQIKISHELGYIDVLNTTFVSIDQINNIPDNELVIVTTGSQGEENAALMRLAQGIHQKLTLKPTDTIVFSSSRIPGNEGKIDTLINLLTLTGAKIITNDYLALHTTGHGHQEDQKLLLRLLKPKFLMPIHGEPSMLVAHKEIAMELGYAPENVVLTEDGSIVEINQNGWQVKENIKSTPLWVEGNRVGDFDPEIVVERKLLTDEGVVLVTLSNVESSSFGTDNIEILHKGFFIQKKDDYLYTTLIKSIIDHVSGLTTKERETVRASVKRHIENELVRQYEKKPMIIVSVI